MATRTITIHPGETVVLPKGTSVDSLILDGAISVTSTCPNLLPTPSAYKCGYFIYVRADNNSDNGQPYEEEHGILGTLYVGDTQYVINESIDNPDAATLNTHVTDQSLFTFTNVAVAGDYTNRKYYALYFKTPEPLFNGVRLSIDERGNGVVVALLIPNEKACDVYDVTA